MKRILLWDPRFAGRDPLRLLVDDAVASAAVRAGVAAAANPAEQGALATGTAVDPGNLIEIALQHGSASRIARVIVPQAVAQVAVAAGVAAAVAIALAAVPSNAVSLLGDAITLNGDILTIGA